MYIIEKEMVANDVNSGGDYRDVENVDWIVEYSHKNGIYCVTRNVIKFATFWMDKSKVGNYTWIKTWYGLMSVNINLQKYHLNMNPACSVCLRVPAGP